MNETFEIDQQQLVEFFASSEGPEGTLSYTEIQSFLFAVSCSLELVPPSEWLSFIYDDQDANYSSLEQARAVTAYLMEFYNRCVEQLDNLPVSLSGDIEPLPDAMQNFDSGTSLAQW